MFEQILVPLDGSPRAERALPVAAQVARASRGSIVLLHVIPPRMDYGGGLAQMPQLTEQSIETELAEVSDYLDRVAQARVLRGIATSTAVRFGLPAPAILAEAESQAMDLIVMGSHGRSGFTRWVLGSVAQKVARHSPVPVLVLRAGEPLPPVSQAETPGPISALVALDGSPLAEAALAPAAYLSAALSAPAQGALHLVRVLRLPTRYEYGQHDGLAEAKEQGVLEAHAYLSTLKQRLHEGKLASLKLSVASSVAVNMDVARTLLGIAEGGEYVEEVEITHGCDVMAMATHGRSGVARWVMGSVTERILGATRLPLLIVRPQRTQTHPEAQTSAEVAEPLAKAQSWVALF